MPVALADGGKSSVRSHPPVVVGGVRRLNPSDGRGRSPGR